MAHNVSHRVYLSRESRRHADRAALQALRTMMETPEGAFDFNVLFPYPQHFRDQDAAIWEAFKLGKKLEAGLRSSGGYNWLMQHWGVTQNATNIGYTASEVYLATMSFTPRPIWIELSKRLPDLTLWVEYAMGLGGECRILEYAQGVEKSSMDASEISYYPHAFSRLLIAEHTIADLESKLDRFYHDAP